ATRVICKRYGAPVMHSSQSDIAVTAEMPLAEFAPADEMSLTAGPDALVIRQRSWIKRVLPQTMFGRSLLLIVMPLVLVQIIATWVFYGRHWETVSRRLSADTAGDIGMVIDAMRYADTELEMSRLLENASGLTGIAFSITADTTLPAQ